ncbi:cell division protein FtsQ/DivIB, partial [Aerococcus sp. L_32]
MMDWEEERIRQERRERRRRLHEKLAENARTDVARRQDKSANKSNQDAVQNGVDSSRQDEDQDQAKLEKKQAASNINKQKSSKQKPVKKKAKQKTKWRLPKFNIKGKANSKKQKQGQAGKRKQQVTSNQGMPPVKKVQKSGPTNWKKMVLLLLPFVIALFVAGYYASPLNHVASITVEGVEDTESMNLSPLNEGMS